ncbi:cbb3-type cytochrome oxidase subunit 3 [Pseudomonas sp. SDO528_S397]
MGFAYDAGTIRGVGTLVVAIAFIGLSMWVFSRRRTAEFEQARQLPFADEPSPTDAQAAPTTRSPRP